jgi:hypothetical protein
VQRSADAECAVADESTLDTSTQMSEREGDGERP